MYLEANRFLLSFNTEYLAMVSFFLAHKIIPAAANIPVLLSQVLQLESGDNVSYCQFQKTSSTSVQKSSSAKSDKSQSHSENMQSQNPATGVRQHGPWSET